MARPSFLGLAFLVIGATSAWSQVGTSCVVPDQKNTFKSLDEFPREVVALAQKKWPGLKPTMASCPPTGKPDLNNLCYYNGGHFGFDWIVAVSTAGTLPTRGFGVFFYLRGAEAREENVQEITIPLCSLHRIANISPKPPKSAPPVRSNP